MHTTFIRLIFAVCVAVCATHTIAAPGVPGSPGVPLAWEQTFDAVDGPADARIFYRDRDGGETKQDLMIRQVQDGVLRLGIRYHPDLKQDDANMMFGDPLWGSPAGPAWGPFDLKTYPFVEIKWRSNAEGFAFYYGVESAGGERLTGYTWPRPERQQTDADGREWSITRFRIAPDSSVPTGATAVKLLGLNLSVRCAKSQGRPTLRDDVWAELDYIRVRGFTDEEARREQNVIASFADFPSERWRGFDDFFPFGVYGAGYLRSDFEYWGGDYQGAYGLFARHGFNLVAANDEIELGRFGGQQSEAGLERYIDEMRRLMGSAKENGIRLTADVRRMMDARDPYAGYTQLLPIARRLAAAFADDDVVVGWKLADEPGASQILKYGMIIRALRESDPLHRPDMIVFNNVAAYKTYAAYSQLAYWDHYPGHNVWRIRQIARDYGRAAAGKPVWAVLQSFETRPPARSYERTSDAETRVMAYMSLAEGAKGLIWFNGWSGSGRDQGMITRTGRPQGQWMHTLKDLARVLIPIGRRLLATEPLRETHRELTKKDDVPVKVYQFASPDPDGPLRIEMTDYALPLSLVRSPDVRGLEISVLRHRDQNLHYLVLVNEGLDATRRGNVTLPAEMLADGAGVYDLHRLDGHNLIKGATFDAAPLAGGDGRIYLVAAPDAYQAQATAIGCDRAREAVRTLLPDLTITKKWELPVGAVEQAVSGCRSAADRGDAAQAQVYADHARRALHQIMAQNSEFNVTRRMLDEIARELDEVVRIAEMDSLEPKWWTGRNHRMLVPNPGYLELSKQYWSVGRGYRDLYTCFIRGDKAGLGGDVFKLRMQCLQARDGLLGMLRERLRAQNPNPAE